MIISLMHIHLAENVKLMSRRVEFWEAVLFFSPYWENCDTSPLLNSGQYLIFCRDCGKCHHIMSFMPQRKLQKVKTPREAGRGDEKTTPESKSINNVTD